MASHTSPGLAVCTARRAADSTVREPWVSRATPTLRRRRVRSIAAEPASGDATAAPHARLLRLPSTMALVNTRRVLGTGPRTAANSPEPRRTRLATEGAETGLDTKPVLAPTKPFRGRRTLGEGPTQT